MSYEDKLFDNWWNCQGDWTEEPNERRDGLSGVQLIKHPDHSHHLLYSKRQNGHTHRSLLHPFGRPTILRELEAYLAYKQLGIRVPHIIYCSARKQGGNWQALLVTEALEGYVSLKDWYDTGAAQKNPADVTKTALQKMAKTLAHLHRSGWQHGCLYAKHVFLKVISGGDQPVVDIALLDLEKSKRRWTAQKASDRDISSLFRHRDLMPITDWNLFKQCYDEHFIGKDG